MLNWDIDNMSKFQDEILRQAEKDHLAQEVVDDMRKLNPHYNPTLAWVGRRIMDIGAKLVQISGNESDKPDLHAN
ncbi:MAG: hypothetical protein U0521_20160 [Anaerolineae bacterium]